MPIYASRKTFKPAPEGLWDGVCIDVVDKGIVETNYGPKHKVQIRWVVNAEPKRTDGKPHMVSMSYPVSMDERSNLRKMLELWRGKKFTGEETKRFDIETLLGAPCQIQVAHGEGNDGDAYAFPQVVMKARTGAQKVQAPSDYVRECDRTGYKAPVLPVEDEEPVEESYQAEESDIPF